MIAVTPEFLEKMRPEAINRKRILDLMNAFNYNSNFVIKQSKDPSIGLFFFAKDEEKEKAINYFFESKNGSNFELYKKICSLAAEAKIYLDMTSLVKFSDLSNDMKKVVITKTTDFKIEYFRQAIKDRKFAKAIKDGYINGIDFINTFSEVSILAYTFLYYHQAEIIELIPELKDSLYEIFDFKLDRFTNKQIQQFQEMISKYQA